MAYAEKRGKGPRPWRIKYKLPDGKGDSRSGFETKNAALTWGRDQETRIGKADGPIRSQARSPSMSGSIAGDASRTWSQHHHIREYMLRRFILPAGQPHDGLLSNEEITEWENGLPAATTVSRRTARAARTVLCTILGDAAAARPPLIPYNPALRPRNRGRRTGRRIERSPQRVWATPYEVLLIAERAALLPV